MKKVSVGIREGLKGDFTCVIEWREPGKSSTRLTSQSYLESVDAALEWASGAKPPAKK